MDLQGSGWRVQSERDALIELLGRSSLLPETQTWNPTEASSLPRPSLEQARGRLLCAVCSAWAQPLSRCRGTTLRCYALQLEDRPSVSQQPHRARSSPLSLSLHRAYPLWDTERLIPSHDLSPARSSPRSDPRRFVELGCSEHHEA